MPSHSSHRVSCVAGAIPALIMLFSWNPACFAQNPPATAIVTDQAPLATLGQFGVPNQYKLADNGDVYFTSGGDTALFRWNRAASERRRIVQTNDPIELLGLPPAVMANVPSGSLIDTAVSLLQVSPAGVAVFSASAAMTGQRDPGAVIVYDGSSFRMVSNKLSSWNQLLINPAGRIAMLGNPDVNGAQPNQIYIETAPGVMTLAAEQGKPSPAGGTMGNLTLLGWNDAGQAAILAGASGSNGWAVLLADGDSLKLVVKSGDSASGKGQFNLRSIAGAYFLNNRGEVAFAADVSDGTTGIWIGSAGAAPVLVVRQGDPPGGTFGGNYGQFVLRGFNDAGQVLYSALMTGRPQHALLLKDRSDNPPAAVFTRGQAAAGTSGNFEITQQAVLSNSGQVAFLATLSGDQPGAGWYFSSGTGDPVKIVAQREAAPGGGWLGLMGRNSSPLINSVGQVVFLADVPDMGTTGLYSWTADGGLVPVVTTGDALPEGSATVLRAGARVASDAEVVVRVLQAGGKATYYAAELKPAAASFRKIVADFDAAPDVGIVAGPASLSVNAKGEAVFFSQVLNPDTYPRAGILAGLPDGRLLRVALSGDELPGGGQLGSTFGPPLLNNQSVVAFHAATDTPGVSGIFLAPLNSAGLQQIVRSGDAWPGGGSMSFNIFNPNLALNDAGQVGFQVASTPAMRPGLFIGSVDGPPIKIAEGGDPTPAGSINMLFSFKMNSSGQVAFSASYGSGSAGLFLGSTSTAPQAVATPGAVAPGSGGQTYYAVNASSVALNNAGQVAFSAALCCNGPSTGWFVGSGGSDASLRLLGNQPLPAGGRAGAMFPVSSSGALADSGELAIYLGEADGTDGRFSKLFQNLSVTPSGLFIFSAMLANGQTKGGVFVNIP